MGELTVVQWWCAVVEEQKQWSPLTQKTHTSTNICLMWSLCVGSHACCVQRMLVLAGAVCRRVAGDPWAHCYVGLGFKKVNTDRLSLTRFKLPHSNFSSPGTAGYFLLWVSSSSSSQCSHLKVNFASDPLVVAITYSNGGRIGPTGTWRGVEVFARCR